MMSPFLVDFSTRWHEARASSRSDWASILLGTVEDLYCVH